MVKEIAVDLPPLRLFFVADGEAPQGTIPFRRLLETPIEAWGELGKGGWYRTGDLARLDEQGYLMLVGRKKEVIIRGGQNIYPKEIEDLLLSHPRVTQAVGIGIPDPVMGERACACVTPVKGQDVTFEEMSSFLKGEGLAIHKHPERLEVMEEFPQLVDGQKVDKISLKKRILDKIEAEKKRNG
jgi:non-ribosomal peptide synthetase component E (peptide arylation enzyme)